MRDLRFAFRALRRSPGFTTVAVLLLALGVGANTAVFTVVRAVLLQQLPYPDSNRLLQVVRANALSAVSAPEFEFWRDHTSAFQSSAAYREQTLELNGDWFRTLAVTDGFFGTLGVHPATGREFTSQETRPAGPPLIILTDGLWRRLSDAHQLSHLGYEVVGILPPGFWFPVGAEAFVPLRFTGSVSDQGANTGMIARLKPGIALGQATTEMAALAPNYRPPDDSLLPRGYRGLAPFPLHDWLARDSRTTLLLLFGAVFVLLLITCSNLAGLFIARLAARRKEIGVRLALGSSSGRLFRQLLMENLLLSIGGALAGLLGGASMLDGMLAVIPFPLPASAPIRLDQTVLWFTIAIAIGMNTIFGFAPLVNASRVDILAALKAGRNGAGARQRMRTLFLTGEVALSATLLISAALLIQSLYRLHQERLGFAPQGLVTFWTPSPRDRSTETERQFQAQSLEKLRSIPGVRNAAAVDMLPLNGPNNFPTQREGHPDQSIGGMEIRAVTPGYFETMGTPVTRGRGFTESDNTAGTPVILVSETLARIWWGKEDPIGDHVVIGLFQGRRLGDDVPREVVGVVTDAKRLNPAEAYRPTVYVPSAQRDSRGMSWVVRGDFRSGFAEQLRQAIHEIDPHQRIERIRTMQEIVASTTAEPRFDAWVFGAFAALALALTAVGVYGVISFSVARRTYEIGTRIALGATRSQIVRLVLRQGIAPVTIGLAIGLAAGFGLTRWLASLLYQVRPTNLMSYVSAAAVLAAAAMFASYLPARRASKVDPIVALRSE